MTKTKRVKPSYSIKVEIELGRKLRRMAFEYDMTMTELFQFLLDNLLNKK